MQQNQRQAVGAKHVHTTSDGNAILRDLTTAHLSLRNGPVGLGFVEQAPFVKIINVLGCIACKGSRQLIECFSYVLMVSRTRLSVHAISAESISIFEMLYPSVSCCKRSRSPLLCAQKIAASVPLNAQPMDLFKFFHKCRLSPCWMAMGQVHFTQGFPSVRIPHGGKMMSKATFWCQAHNLSMQRCSSTRSIVPLLLVRGNTSCCSGIGGLHILHRCCSTVSHMSKPAAAASVGVASRVDSILLPPKSVESADTPTARVVCRVDA